MAFVLDVSIAAVWALADESDPVANAILLAWMENPRAQEVAYVPALWWYEMRNVLTINERRKRITAEESDAFLRTVGFLPILEDLYRDGATTLALARKYQLSFYDAAYLELAQRKDLPLTTLDVALRNAAEKCGVQLRR